MDLQILILMAGRGRRFAEAGYDRPKPFIDVDGMPMVRRVLGNLPKGGYLSAIYCAEHELLVARHVGCLNAILVSRVDPRGAAASILLNKDHLNGDAPLLVVNADQWLDWSPAHFADYVARTGCDGAIPVFRASGTKWSYASFGDDMVVTEVAEKVPISSDATAGLYYFRQARLCFGAVARMMEAERTVNGEYYVCPAFNEMIVDGARVLAYPVARMWGMGTPADLRIALEARPWRTRNGTEVAP